MAGIIGKFEMGHETETRHRSFSEQGRKVEITERKWPNPEHWAVVQNFEVPEIESTDDYLVWINGKRVESEVLFRLGYTPEQQLDDDSILWTNHSDRNV